MNRLTRKAQNLQLRKKRIRATVVGTTGRPRLAVYVSNMHVTAQIIDDSKHHTVAYASTVGAKKLPETLTERAAWVGTEIGKKAATAKVKKIVFDRGGRAYHGRVKALAEAARKAGLEF